VISHRATKAELAARVAELEAELTLARAQHTATSEILRVISSSPTNLQPTLDAIARNAARVCGTYDATVLLLEGDFMRRVAHYGPIGSHVREVRPLSSGFVGNRAILDRRPVHVDDILATEPTDLPDSRASAEAFGFRTLLAVPLLRQNEAIGVLTLRRQEVQPFSDKQIELLKTFADQAVIAIENVRLFNETKEALEQQTATSEILRAISTSPTDLQPVLGAVVKSAARFCGADDASLFRLDGGNLRADAHHGPVPQPLGLLVPVVPGTVGGRAVLERRAVHVPDLQAETQEFPEGSAFARELGHRTTLGVPLLREGAAIGVIQLRRAEVNPFTEKQIALLTTFADQAVIAIENVRLFTELQDKNHALTESLERQTATSEILRVISSSPTDVQPVFDTIVRNAVRLCGAVQGHVYRFDGELIHLVAQHNFTPEQLVQWQRTFPRRLEEAGGFRQVFAAGVIQHATDVESDRESAFTPAGRAILRALRARSALTVPMFRQGQVVGAIALNHHEVGVFTDAHVELLKTFADQAVIAIENARLLTELQARTQELTRSVDELTALGDVSRALSSTLDLETVLQTIVARANQLAGTAGCTIWEYDEAREEFRLRVSHYADERDVAILEAPDRVTTIRRGQGVTTQVVELRRPVQIPDITVAGAYESPLRRALIDAGHRALLGLPLLREEDVIGVLAVTRKTPGEFAPQIVKLLSTFATQSALATQNARLFREIEEKSRQLEAASRHKSEFLSNMSHELRTPLNAIIGFSEVLGDRMFGELTEKQDEYLRDIMESGQHLLSLINDILDLSKIEAGRMELELTDFDLPEAIDNALTLVRERAGRRGIALHQAVDERLGEIRGDERKVKQVLLNLLSNALKFTPEGGRIDVSARLQDGLAEISVKDTGVGIAPEDQEAVFEEFRQVGTAARKVEGTGLGLALSRKFVELHGGRIWVKSQVGVGSTFTFTIPVRRGE
jgi:signal transduction histidine kinase